MNYLELIMALLEKATEEELERLFHLIRAYIRARRK